MNTPGKQQFFAPFPSLPSTRGRVVGDPKGTRGELALFSATARSGSKGKGERHVSVSRTAKICRLNLGGQKAKLSVPVFLENLGQDKNRCFPRFAPSFPFRFRRCHPRRCQRTKGRRASFCAVPANSSNAKRAGFAVFLRHVRSGTALHF
jgi:hypothetical protein